MSLIEELRLKIKNEIGLCDSDIPADIKISTITICAKLSTNFYPSNIEKYIETNPYGIISKPTINDKKKKKKNVRRTSNKKNNLSNMQSKDNKNKQKNDMQNQVTVKVSVSKKDKPLSIKIFKNGSLHFTGCKNIDDIIEATEKICIECKKTRGIIVNGKIKEIVFAENIDELRVENLHNFSVKMINSDFRIPFKIDRPKLYVKLKSENYITEFDTNKHAGVKIKYLERITIFVFESGSIIIILGSQGFEMLSNAYTFVYKYLLESYDVIVKNDALTNSGIIKCLEKDKKAIKADKYLDIIDVKKLESMIPIDAY